MTSGIWNLEFGCLARSLLAIAGLSGVAYAEGTLRIVPLVRAEQVIVSVDLDNGYTDEVRQVINGGVRTTFTYDVDLKMIVPAWVDRTIATAVVTTTDHYDTLTRVHNLSRSVDGRVVEALATENEAVAKKWLTSLNGLVAVPHVAARSAPRVLRAHQRARAPARRDAARLGDRRHEPREIHVRALGVLTQETQETGEILFEKNLLISATLL